MVEKKFCPTSEFLLPLAVLKVFFSFTGRKDSKKLVKINRWQLGMNS